MKKEPIQFPKTEKHHNDTAVIIKTVIITTLVVSAFFALGIVSYQGHLHVKSTKKTANPKQFLSQNARPTDVPFGDETMDTDAKYQDAMQKSQYIPPAGWKKYMTKDTMYSLYYPPDWKLTDESKNVDLYNDGKTRYQQNISISNGDYTIKTFNPLAWGPNVCLYPDSPPFDGPGDITETYTEVKGNDGVFRRPDPSTYDVPGEKLRWFICKKGTDEFFTSVSGFGSTYYDTPSSYDPTMLLIMDGILESFSSANTQ